MTYQKTFLRILSAVLCLILLISCIPALAETQAIITGKGKVNLRKSPSMSSKILSSYEPGTRVTVESEGETWCKVSVDGETGYMRTNFLSIGKSSHVMYVRTYTGVKLRLREKPTVFSKVLGTFKPGTAVVVIERGKAWTKVSVDGMKGYMGSQYLTSTKP